MTKYYIEMKETRRNMMSDALLSLYRKKGPESEEARQMGLKLWDFDLKEKRMEITSDEQRVLRHALNDLRNQILDRKQVERIRKMYPEGTQICLDEMEGERNMPSGLKGKVCYVDDAGQIHVNWENGSSLAVLPEVDSFHKIGEPHKRKEHDMQR